MYNLETELYNEELKCSLVEAIAQYETRHVTLIVRGEHCADMVGAINFCTRLMPKVTNILTLSKRECDTAYVLETDGWKAYRVYT